MRIMYKPIVRLFQISACTVLLTLMSCGSDDGGGGAARTTVNVTLDEFSVTPNQSSAPHGQVTFHVSNVGDDMHEFLVIRTDLAPDALPTEANGSYEENGAGTVLLDEIEDIDSGGSADLTLDLDSGHYVLICNMVHQEGAVLEVHYALGMRTDFDVT